MLNIVMGVLFCILMLAGLALVVFGLPGLWLILILNAVWAFIFGGAAFTTSFFVWLAALAVFAEVAEFLLGHYGTKYFGGSTQASFAGIIGAIIGSILGAPLFFGLGALLGALVGAFVACLVAEMVRGMAFAPASKAAFGSAIGRFGGFVVKMGVGIAMLFMSFPAIFE